MRQSDAENQVMSSSSNNNNRRTPANLMVRNVKNVHFWTRSGTVIYLGHSYPCLHMSAICSNFQHYSGFLTFVLGLRYLCDDPQNHLSVLWCYTSPTLLLIHRSFITASLIDLLRSGAGDSSAAQQLAEMARERRRGSRSPGAERSGTPGRSSRSPVGERSSAAGRSSPSLGGERLTVPGAIQERRSASPATRSSSSTTTTPGSKLANLLSQGKVTSCFIFNITVWYTYVLLQWKHK